MSYSTHNYVDGQVLFAKDLNEMDSQIKKYERDIVNLDAAAKGKLYREDVDDTEAYTKAIADDVLPLASFDKIGGKSVVWNNLTSLSDTGVKNGIIITTDGKSLIANGTPTGRTDINFLLRSSSDTLISGHKVFVSAIVENANDIAYTVIIQNQHTGYVTLASSDKDLIGIYTVPVVDISYWEGWFRFSDTSKTLKNVKITTIIVDLTSMFGAGNEPTSVYDDRIKFIKAYAKSHPEHNTGEVIHADVDSVVSKGRNIFDARHWNGISGFTKTYDDVYTGTVVSFRTASNNDELFDNIKFVDNTAYTIMFDVAILGGNTDTNFRFEVFYEDGTIYNTENVNGTNGKYKSIKCTTNGKTISAITVNYGCHGDDIVTVSNVFICVASDNVSYIPYFESTIAIPEAIRNIEGYGWSAGDVYNEVDFVNKKFIKRVGRVDMGTVTWYKGGTGYYYADIKPLMKRTSSVNEVANMTTVFPKKAQTTFESEENGIAYFYSSSTDTVSRIVLHNTTVENVSALKTFLNGQMFYYELAEPEIIDIADAFDNTIEVEAGGTITFHQPDSKCLPIPNQETFVVKVGDA